MSGFRHVYGKGFFRQNQITFIKDKFTIGRYPKFNNFFDTRIYCKTISIEACPALWKINRIIFFSLLPIRKKVAYDNLTLCFPEKEHKWKKNVIKDCYINLGIDMMEFLYLPKMNKEVISELIKFNCHNLVQQSISESKGTFILSGHFSNWELMAFAYAKYFNLSLKIIAKVQASKELNEKINKYRKMSGNQIIEIGYSLRAIYEELSKNGIFCFLIDQSANPDYSVYIYFFGQRVATFSGPAKIALKKRPGLILAYGLRKTDYSYDINFEKIEYDDLTEYNDNNVTELTQRIQTGFENVIRKNPAQWLWLHKRFKHTKNG